MSIVSGSKPALRSAGRIGVAGHSPLGRVCSSMQLADAGLDQHAPGRRLDEQAVERLGERVVGVDLGLDQPLPHDPRHGTKAVPASEVNVPAWMSATRTPPPRSALQSTDSFSRLARSALGAALVTLRVASKSW